jgi:hypothetical protein
VTSRRCRRNSGPLGSGADLGRTDMITIRETGCMADVEWALKGELVLSCNCTVFCPCVLSLGQHPPTEGYCQTWAGFRVDNGYYGDTDLVGPQSRPDHGDSGLHEPRQLDRRPVRRQAGLDLRDQGLHQDLYGQGWRNNVAACRSWSGISSVCNRSRSATRSRTRSESSRYPKIIDGDGGADTGQEPR